MALPKMDKDLAIIQQLSDLPNSEDGLTADELKAKFDEAALAIKAYLNEKLIPAIAAENIPFKKTTEITAGDVQTAIEAVQRQIVAATIGSIPNGSITKEKLAAEVIARAYGGLAWVSADTPDGMDSPTTDFPIGQSWLRPAFTVTNLGVASWTGANCDISVTGTDVKMTGKKQAGTMTATQNVYNAGQAGDRIRILFEMQDKDSEIGTVSVSVNSGAATAITGKTVLEKTIPSGGSLSVALSATFSATALADGSVTFARYTVVNLDAIMRQMAEGTKEIADWNTYLWDTLPSGFTSFYSAEAVFIQSKSGTWEQISFETLPISRGGTGITQLPANRYVKTDMDGNLDFPTTEEVHTELGILSTATGEYTGTGEARTMTLDVTPKLLYLFPKNGAISNATSSYVTDNPVILASGAEKNEVWSVRSGDGYRSVIYKVTLSGSQLTFSGQLGNRASEPYQWFAIY